MSIKLAAVELKAMRRQILERPELLTGVREPALETVWAYCHAIQHALDVVLGRVPGEWSHFLGHVKKFGMHYEFTYMRRNFLDYKDQLKFLLDLYTEYDTWYEHNHSPRSSDQS